MRTWMQSISMNVHPSPIMHHIWSFRINQFFLISLGVYAVHFTLLDRAGEAVPKATATIDAYENEFGNTP